MRVPCGRACAARGLLSTGGHTHDAKSATAHGSAWRPHPFPVASGGWRVQMKRTTKKMRASTLHGCKYADGLLPHQFAASSRPFIDPLDSLFFWRQPEHIWAGVAFHFPPYSEARGTEWTTWTEWTAWHKVEPAWTSSTQYQALKPGQGVI